VSDEQAAIPRGRSDPRASSAGGVETGTVVGLTHEGAGIVRDGKTAFVIGALPGEVIHFRRQKRHRQYDEALLIEVLEPSAERAEPRCKAFGVCGGCSLQHLAPERQLHSKEAELRDNLERIAKVSPDRWLESMQGPVWNYRRRARLGAKYVKKKDRVVVGFRERLAPYVADVQRCEVLQSPLDGLITPLGEMLTRLDTRERIPQIEVAVADNATALVLRVLDAPTTRDLAVLRDFERERGVRFYLQPGGLDSIARLPSEDVAGEQPLFYGLPDFNLALEFSPTDFIQINGAINRQLVTRAVDFLELGPESRVLDLYCGLGNFTLALARKAGQVVGVEGEAGLIERARHNARRNAVSNAEFHVANLAETPLPGTLWAKGGFTHVLLDPPRVGAREVLTAVAGFRPQRVLYISCHPGSLARDIGILVHDHGFALRAAGVLDMFPHTNHVESMAVLEPLR
jgi:23S rRNA (uracil1939-C5)-methyltransferase